MKLHDLSPNKGSRRAKVRVGRGRRGRRGKTAGRGTKGARARGTISPIYEGGQTPLSMRVPKLKGFKPINKITFTVVNVEALSAFDQGSVIDPDALRTKGLVKKRGKVKVLGNGKLDKPLTVKAHAFSSEASSKIKAAGGTTEVV